MPHERLNRATIHVGIFQLPCSEPLCSELHHIHMHMLYDHWQCVLYIRKKHFGKVCPYIPLCTSKVDTIYTTKVQNNFFTCMCACSNSVIPDSLVDQTGSQLL